MIKQSINEFFVRLKEKCKDCEIDLKVPNNSRIPSEMIVGSEDDEGYVYWNILERLESINEKEISLEIGFKLHESLVEFINSYFFINMTGIYKGMEISFDTILPTTNISKFILKRCEHLNINKPEMRYIQIGVISREGNDNLLMCFDNKLGEVLLYDYDKELIQVIANALPELISGMEPRC